MKLQIDINPLPSNITVCDMCDTVLADTSRTAAVGPIIGVTYTEIEQAEDTEKVMTTEYNICRNCFDIHIKPNLTNYKMRRDH